MVAQLAPAKSPLAPAPQGIEGILAGDPQREADLAQKEQATEDKIESAEKEKEGLHPPELQTVPPPVPKSTDPKEMWGSAAMMLAGIGSLFTRNHMTTALNAASQVFNAYHQKDQLAANQAYQTWKVANENALKSAEFQQKTYENALRKADSDEKGALAEFTAAAHAFSDTTGVQQAQINGIKGVEQLMLERQRLGVELAKAAPELQEKHAQWDAYLGLTQAQQDLQKAAATKDPAKVKAAQDEMDAAVANAKNLSMAMGKGGAAAGGAGKLDDETLDEMADQALAGDKSVLSGLGYGNTGAANRAALRMKMSAKMRAQGMSGADLAAKNAEFFGMTAGERTLGTVAARIGLGSAEAEQLIPLVEKASKALPRSNYPTMNAWMQALQTQAGDPRVRDLDVKLQALKNAYSQVLTRGGVPTDAARTQADDLFAKKDPDEVLRVAIGAVKQEATAVRAAPGIVQGEMRERLEGTSGGASHPDDISNLLKKYGIQ